jgi:hypothetical protein
MGLPGMWLVVSAVSGLTVGGRPALADSPQATEAAVSFELDIEPILSARGCNQGACHGKARGQNGFQLSLLAFDPDFDYAALTQHARGRRVFPAAPENSLLLLKATAAVPHGGGRRVEPGGDDYLTLRRWIEQGTPRLRDGEPRLERVAVAPDLCSLQPGEQQSLSVTAYYSDGSTRDVTPRTSYQSNEEGVVSADPTGRVHAGNLPGEAAIMARYMNLIAVCHVTIPVPGAVPPQLYAELPRHNYVDDLVWRKLEKLAVTPSPVVDDAKFLRRVHLDIIGRLPTPHEVRAFLADSNPEKRQRLVDSLLSRPEFADHWANKWMDLLRPNPYRVGVKAVLNYDAWIRDSFRQNKPYDQFVRELITAQGSTWRNGATTLFRDRREPDEIATLVSQLFLGLRLECAKCHHHPFEKWSQEDFYSFAAFFARVGRKGTGLSPPISGGEEMVFTSTGGSVRHPLTQEVLAARPLFGELPASGADEDPREGLATWMTSADNPYFAQAAVNRVWAELMGRGIVEPVDDLRLTNPPTNGPLLDALAQDFVQQGYDLKHLLRVIATSRVYQLQSLPNDRNASDSRNYSRHYRRRLRAEVLVDAVSDITGLRDGFSAMPAGSRASEIWTHRVDSVFLDTFGRPNPNQDPPCERTMETTVTQALHLMNSPDLHAKIISDAGRVARLAERLAPDLLVEELYLWAYARYPDAEEKALATSLFQEAGTTPRKVAEDLLWALINTPEFVFVD